MARPGYVLIAVLLVIVILSLAAYRFADAMAAEYAQTVRATEAAQARAYAVSGVHYAMAVLSDPTILSQVLGGNPYDNPSVFANVRVGLSDARGGGMFSLINLSDTGGGTGEGKYLIKYGVTDEAGKVNLNSMMRIDSSGESLRIMLKLLPNMTEDVADAIVDWVHPEDSGTPPVEYELYRPKKGPLSTVDELLLIRGITADRLYGNDRNRNGRLDPGEADGNEFNRGWSDYLTVYGHELNVDSTGKPRIYLNQQLTVDFHKRLTDALGSELADFIVAYRMYGTSSSLVPLAGNARQATAEELNAAVLRSLNGSPRARKRFRNSVTSMRNTRVTLPRAPDASPDSPSLVYDCPINSRERFAESLPLLLDKTTAKSNFELNPRINVNTAPQDLLLALPGLTAEDVQNAIQARRDMQPGTPEYTTGAWLVTRAQQRPEIFQQLERFITGQTMTYRVHSIGYFARGGPVARVEAVIDTNYGRPRIVYFRDLTELGGGFTPPR